MLKFFLKKQNFGSFSPHRQKPMFQNSKPSLRHRKLICTESSPFPWKKKKQEKLNNGKPHWRLGSWWLAGAHTRAPAARSSSSPPAPGRGDAAPTAASAAPCSCCRWPPRTPPCRRRRLLPSPSPATATATPPPRRRRPPSLALAPAARPCQAQALLTSILGRVVRLRLRFYWGWWWSTKTRKRMIDKF